MPTWWTVGVAIYVPLFVVALVAWCRQEGESLWTAAWVSVVFLGLSTASAVFWFG